MNDYKKEAEKKLAELKEWEQRKEILIRLNNEDIDLSDIKLIKREKKPMWLKILSLLSFLKTPAIALAFKGACWVGDHLINKVSPHLLEYFAITVVPKRTLGIDVETLIEETAKTQSKWDDMVANFIAGRTVTLKKRQIELEIQ